MDKESLDKKNNNNKQINREYMGACGYGIFLGVFNSIAHEWDAELNSRKESSTSNHVSFRLSYRHNIPLLTRKVNFINEWK